MVPASITVSFVIAVIFTFVLPFAAIIFLRATKRITAKPMLLGAVAFIVSQMILRMPLLTLLSGQQWYMDFAGSHYILLLIIICLSAGLFEETARLSGAMILKNERTFKDIISFGLGHALCEVILIIGAAHVNNVIFCMTINGVGSAFTVDLPPETMSAITAQMLSINPAHVYLGLLERVSTVLFHLFATVLVFNGVIEKKPYFYVLAILAHTVFNFAGVLLNQAAGVVISELVLLIMALAAGYYVLKMKNEMTC